jgi:hypothetical protein
MIPFRPFAFASILLMLSACSHHAPRVTVELLDTSLSITPRAEHAAQNAIVDQISHLGRGDQLILIPITGDAENDAGGKILRLVAPSERQAYDNDLKRFQADAKLRFAAWIASMEPHQMRTDILGMLEVSQQELATVPKNSKRRLIILSDFLEDDLQYRFVSEPQVTSVARARALAVGLRTRRIFTLPGVRVCLGRLESVDFASLSRERKEAVQAFWAEYLNDRGISPQIQYDGSGMLACSDGCDFGTDGSAANRSARGASQP